MRIRVEGYNPTWKDNNNIHPEYEQYYTFDSMKYGPIHEKNEMSREDMIKEFLELYPDFNEVDCRIIRVGEERIIHNE